MNEKGVSPVIGVMLMLVVAVLLAAAVSTYVGQMQMKKPAPTAVFDCRIVKDAPSGMGGTVTYLELKEVSGDTIPTKDLEIITYNPDAYGPHKTMEILPNSNNTRFYMNATAASWYSQWGVSFTFDNKVRNQHNTTIELINGTQTKSVRLIVWNGPQIGTSPYLNDMSQGSFTPGFFDTPNSTIEFYLYNSSGGIIKTLDASYYDFATNSLNITGLGIDWANVSYVKEMIIYHNDLYNPRVSFGNYVVSPGVTMTADWYNDYVQAKWNPTKGWYNGANVTGFCACIADGWNVTPGHYITVKVVYIPTHTVIWEKKVMVESGE